MRRLALVLALCLGACASGPDTEDVIALFSENEGVFAAFANEQMDCDAPIFRPEGVGGAGATVLFHIAPAQGLGAEDFPPSCGGAAGELNALIGQSHWVKQEYGDREIGGIRQPEPIRSKAVAGEVFRQTGEGDAARFEPVSSRADASGLLVAAGGACDLFAEAELFHFVFHPDAAPESLLRDDERPQPSIAAFSAAPPPPALPGWERNLTPLSSGWWLITGLGVNPC
ncbi:MAG: hypothetical protein RKE49_10730 [Oceanicaulis sp.]